MDGTLKKTVARNNGTYSCVLLIEFLLGMSIGVFGAILSHIPQTQKIAS